jgi:hypothetical protein
VSFCPPLEMGAGGIRSGLFREGQIGPIQAKMNRKELCIVKKCTLLSSLDC